MADRKGEANMFRFPHRKVSVGVWECRMCHRVLPGKKTSFCDQRCLRDFFMKTDWRRVRRVVYERDGHHCMICNKLVAKDNYHVDHIIPISKGGEEWDLDNLQLTCPECNLEKSNKL